MIEQDSEESNFILKLKIVVLGMMKQLQTRGEQFHVYIDGGGCDCGGGNVDADDHCDSGRDDRLAS